MRAEPFTTYLWWDVLRVVMLAVALVLIVLVGRMLWWRITNPEPYEMRQTHPASIISYLLAIALIAVWRIRRVGEPPSGDTITAILVLATGTYGAWHRVRLPSFRRKGRR